MLFCCLRRNVETSCHKHFVVVSCRQQTPLLTTSDKCHNLPRSDDTVLITSGRSQRWQHTMKPDIGSESRFLPIPRYGVPVGISPWRLVWKPKIVRLPDSEKTLKICFDGMNERDGWTEGQTDRPHSIARQKSAPVFCQQFLECMSWSHQHCCCTDTSFC